MRCWTARQFNIAAMSSASVSLPAERLRIVLVGTQHPGNIGSAARAMKTMGFSRLVLGCTARSRRIALEELDPRQAAMRGLAVANAGSEVALVFGRERTGLENDELQLCHAAVHIPANPDYSSLNLAAAVQVLAYELRVVWFMDSATPTVSPAGAMRVHEVRSEPPATHAQLEGFFSQLAETLDAIDFHKGRAPAAAMRKFRRLFLRADLDARDVRLLRGMLADAKRMADLAEGRAAAPRGP
jgi:tRNA (cytidine32/uridine32-2'-O)-methyltransferase